MDKIISSDPYLTPLKIIDQGIGSVMHGMKRSDNSFNRFGEAYFSLVEYEMIKGWKKHKKMTLNLIVPLGNIRFIIHDATKLDTNGKILPILDIIIGQENYSRLTVPPGLWMAFQGISQPNNMLLNIADIEHDPNETINKPIDFFEVNGVI